MKSLRILNRAAHAPFGCTEGQRAALCTSANGHTFAALVCDIQSDGFNNYELLIYDIESAARDSANRE